jgi:prepilin-type N-terminal cleavage/methylation domain-containing protein
MASRAHCRTGGFTLIETLVSLGILGVLLVSVFSIAGETYSYIADTDVDYAAQNEANLALSRMTELLRKSGWSTLSGVSYPRPIAGGAELEFRVIRDLDGNGVPLSAATGEIEWGPKVYRIRRDANGNLRVYDGATPVWHLGRYVTSVSFATYAQDLSLQAKELSVALETRKVTRQGNPIDYSLSASIDMRN